jgi:hypothetical protein
MNLLVIIGIGITLMLISILFGYSGGLWTNLVVKAIIQIEYCDNSQTICFTIEGTERRNNIRVNDILTFNVSKQSLGHPSLINYTWNFDDGSTGDGPTIIHSYRSPGNKNVTLTPLFLVQGDDRVEVVHEFSKMIPVLPSLSSQRDLTTTTRQN